jgi:O-antigen/teichoic acid export membrane protein
MGLLKISLLFSMEKYFSSVLIAISYFIFAAKIEPELLGQLSAIEALAIVFSFSSLISLDPVFQNAALKDSKQLDEYFYNAFFVKLFFALLGYLIFSIFSIFIFDYSVFPSLLIGTFIMFKVSNIFQYRLIAHEKNYLYCGIALFSTILSFSLKMILIWFEIENLYALFYVLDALSLFILVILFNFSSSSDYNLNIKLALGVIKNSYLFILSAFSILAFGKIDQLVISKMLTFTDVANYALAMKVIGAFILISTAFNLSYAKKLSEIKQCTNETKYRKHIKSMLLFTISIGALLSSINYFISPVILSVIYGNKFVLASEVIKYSSPLILLIFLSSTIGKILIVEELGHIALIRNVSALILSLSLSIILIPFFNIWGALIASIFSWFICSVVLIMLFKKTRFIYLSI